MEHEGKPRVEEKNAQAIPNLTVDNLKTPRLFLEMLKNITTGQSPTINEQHIIEKIKEARKIKGVRFIEKAIFKAIFLQQLELTRYLICGLEPETEDSMGFILLPLIQQGFSLDTLSKSLDKLIGFVYYQFIHITENSTEDIKTSTIALLFALQHAELEDIGALMKETLNYSVTTLQSIAYASGIEIAKKSTSKTLILIKFLAKACALNYLSINDIEAICTPFLRKAKDDLSHTSLDSPSYEQIKSFVENCTQAHESIINLLRDKYEQFKPYKENKLFILMPKSSEGLQSIKIGLPKDEACEIS